MDRVDGLREAAEVFKILANESRLELLWLLCERPQTVGALTKITQIPQPVVSQHLRTLRHTRLVVATRHGRQVIYAVPDPSVRRLLITLVRRTDELSEYHRAVMFAEGARRLSS